jgi:Ca2+-binding EF-hand superfamily protein
MAAKHGELPEDPFKGKSSKNFDFRLSQEKLLEIKRVFDAYDDDFDGVIDIQYLGMCMRAAGLILTEKDVIKLTSEYDPEEKGVISLANFFVLMARQMRTVEVLEMNVLHASKKMSKQTIIAGTNEINITALRNMLVGKGGEQLNETELDDFMRDITQLSDKKKGTVHFETFSKWIMREVPFATLLEEKTAADLKAKEEKKAKKKGGV